MIHGSGVRSRPNQAKHVFLYGDMTEAISTHNVHFNLTCLRLQHQISLSGCGPSAGGKSSAGAPEGNNHDALQRTLRRVDAQRGRSLCMYE